jgi:hypothetical protein
MMASESHEGHFEVAASWNGSGRLIGNAGPRVTIVCHLSIAPHLVRVELSACGIPKGDQRLSQISTSGV